MTSDKPLLGLPGVGPKTAERLAAVGLTHLSDLCFFAPRRYDDAGALRPFSSLVAGERAFVEGVVKRASIRRFFRRATLEVTLADGNDQSLLLRWFRFRGEVPARFAVGARVRAAGLVRIAQRGREMIQPICDPADGDDRSLRPRYAPIDGVPASLVASLCALACDAIELSDPPTELVSITEAARALHVQPPLPEGDARQALVEGRSPAHERLAFEELLVMRLAAKRADAPRTTALPPIELPKLPYTPTAAQRRAIDEITAALALPRAMRRLLTGDVGSGKTLVAACAIEQCLTANRRAAFLAPTAILAEQQAAALRMLLPQRSVALLHAGTSRKDRESLLQALKSKAPLVVVGTHALLEESVRIDALGLLVIDEQQRFGVRQRSALVDTDAPPHTLALSATPIPRTMALALRGLIEVSHLDEKPAGRAPIASTITTRDRALTQVKRESGLVYWICPTIIDGDGNRGVLTVFDWLTKKLDAPVHLCHGQQSVAERAEQLATFRETGGVLVATTVVEVGLDIPEATLMIIESPERLGLAQLHQLRGRVGRGVDLGRCLLVTERTTRRLELLVREHDGLAIAEADLQLRGMGELGGEEQSGFPSLPPLPQQTLERLLHVAERCATSTEQRDPELREPGHLRLSRRLARALVSRQLRKDGYDSA